MANADVIVLPVIRIERGDVDLGNQRLLGSSDRSRVVELRAVKMAQHWRRLRERLQEGPPIDDFSTR